MKKVKGIICGTGRAGTFLHFGALKSNGAEIIAFVDPDINKAKEAAYLYDVKNFYSSADEALKLHKELDFVDICTPSNTHFDLIKKSLENDCHVLVEKPITNSLEETLKLKSLQKTYNKSITAVHNHKFYPSVENLINKIHRNELGEILSIYKEFSFTDKVRMMEKDHWSHSIPGGRLFEANPHNLYILYSMIGEFDLTSIENFKRSKRWTHTKLDEFFATFKSKSGTNISIKMSLNCDSKSYGKHGPNFFIIVGTKKTFYLDYSNFYEVTKFKTKKDFLKKLFSTRKKNFKQNKKLLDSKKNEINLGYMSGHFYVIEKFIKYIKGDIIKPPVPLEESIFTQKMNLMMGEEVEKKLK